jgi:hypothetical protein
LILSPTWLIDSLLDAIENVRVAPMPAQAGGLSCNEMQFETELDHLPSVGTQKFFGQV